MSQEMYQTKKEFQVFYLSSPNFGWDILPSTMQCPLTSPPPGLSGWRISCQIPKIWPYLKGGLAWENAVWHVRQFLACFWPFAVVLAKNVVRHFLKPIGFELKPLDCFQPVWHLLKLYGIFCLEAWRIWSMWTWKPDIVSVSSLWLHFVTDILRNCVISKNPNAFAPDSK